MLSKLLSRLIVFGCVLALLTAGEWPSNRNNGVRIFDVGPCGDDGVPLPINLLAEMKD